LVNVLCEVIDKQPNWSRGTVDFSLLDTRFISISAAFQVAALASAVPAYPSATAAERQQYMFISSAAAGGENSDGTPGNTIY
jgi:hypothetical protein